MCVRLMLPGEVAALTSTWRFAYEGRQDAPEVGRISSKGRQLGSPSAQPAMGGRQAGFVVWPSAFLHSRPCGLTAPKPNQRARQADDALSRFPARHFRAFQLERLWSLRWSC